VNPNEHSSALSHAFDITWEIEKEDITCDFD